MDFFSQYLQPIITWVSLNPHWALFVTFIVSFSESLAFVGTIIPGTVTMTAVGILAGSGSMRIDLTLLAAILGAIAGDSASYSIGRIFSDRLTTMWPFKRYPHWLSYAKDYFERHGGKSVLIGRFTGPLRSIIPIIAGMMGMNRWYFFVANVASAIGWACLYVIPGVLIGSASSELLPQIASKLFIIILLLLAIIWVLTLGVKWSFVSLNQWLHTYLNIFWTSLMRYPRLGACARYITPEGEINYYPTTAMALLCMFCIIITPPFLYSSIYSGWIQSLNEAIYQFCLSIRTYDFDAFFIIVRLTISFLSLTLFGLAILFYAMYHRDWRLLRFWMSLIITSSVMVWLLSLIMLTPTQLPSPSTLLVLAFPTKGLLFATSMLTFLIYYMTTFYQQTISIVLRIILVIALSLSGIALIYLGEDWFVNVVIAYKIGFANALLHWMIYRRQGKPHYRSYLPITLSVILLIVATAVLSMLFFHKIADTQQINTKQFMIHHKTWWDQRRPLLPIYSMNRFGKEVGLMNIQYVGSIKSLQHTLIEAGWKAHPNSFIYSLLVHIGHEKSSSTLPLMAQLYSNKKPFLLMTKGTSTDKNGLIIRLWRSNYHVQNKNKIIWLGSIQKQYKNNKQSSSELVNHLFPILKKYKMKTVIINPKKIRPLSSASTILLLVEE